MSLAFPPQEPVTLPILGTQARFPLHRIYCVGRNYNDHVVEMGGVAGRDLQAEAKKLGRAWDTAKAFDFSAPLSPIQQRSDVLRQGAIHLDVNGERRQASDISAMIWNVEEIIAALGQYFILKPGDIIFTGTPAGVGPVQRGDRLQGGIAGVGSIDVTVT